MAQSLAQRSCRFFTLIKETEKYFSHRKVDGWRAVEENVETMLLLASIPEWHVTYRVLGVSAGIKPGFVCLWHSRINSLSLYLQSLRVLQLLGLVHVHEEVLQQQLSLRQVFCVHLLVDQGQFLRIALFVLHRSRRSLAVCLWGSNFWRKVWCFVPQIVSNNWKSYHNCSRDLSATHAKKLFCISSATFPSNIFFNTSLFTSTVYSFKKKNTQNI